MKKRGCKFSYKQYEYIYGIGYPFFLVAVTEFEEPDNYVIEYISIHANYNKKENDFFYWWDEANSYLNRGFKKDDLIELGLNQLKQNLENEISSSGEPLKIKSLPLKERNLKIDSLKLLQTMPDFKAIRSEIITGDTVVCDDLKKEFNNLRSINVNLRKMK